MSDSTLINFVNIENTKTKIATIAREMLGIEGPIKEDIMDEMAFQTMTFIEDMERLINSEEEDKMYILADLFVANIITTSLTFHKLQEMIEAYEKLDAEHKELKERCGE
jgi:hypothetical protein